MPIFDFNTSSKHNSIVKELVGRINAETLQHEGNSDPKWAAGQVEHLAAAVSKHKYLENLLKGLVEESPVSPCCPASTKKVLGADIYIYSIKLFRYSFVRNNTRVKCVPNCQSPPGGNRTEVCINPYHYELVRPNMGIPAVHVDTEMIQHGAPVPQRIMDHCFQTMGDLRGSGPPTAFVSGDELNEHINNSLNGVAFSRPTDLFMPDATAATRNQFLSEVPEGMSPSTSLGGHSAVPSPGSPNSFMTNDDRIHSPSSFFTAEESMDTDDVDTTARGAVRLAEALPPELQASLQLPPKIVKADVEFTEPEHWVSITYYERSRRIGAPVDCRSPYVLVDGFTGPYTSSRVSLAYFTNPQRDIGTSRALLYIGRGARLYYLGGEVFIECLSNHPIYVQSPNCNQRHGWHAATVVQVPSGCNLKIFSYAEFSSQLAECIKYGFDAVYALARLCTIRVSFVKGWGSAFRRQQVTATPCWIECHLNGALEWVDNVLSKMGCPSRVCTSFS